MGTTQNKAILWLELLCTVLASFLEQKELLMGTQGRAVCSLCLFTWTQEGQWDRQQMASHTLFQAALCLGNSKTVSEQAESTERALALVQRGQSY